MPSAGSYRRFCVWAAGNSDVQRLDIGPSGEDDRTRPSPLGLLRIGFLGSAIGERVSASLKIGDNGSILGPVDVPLAIVVETPVTVELQPEVGRQSGEIRLVLSVSPVWSGAEVVAHCNRVVTGQAAETLVLPQWVRRVTTLASATFQFRDSAGGLLQAVAVSGVFERPSFAAALVVGAPGAFLLSY